LQPQRKVKVFSYLSFISSFSSSRFKNAQHENAGRYTACYVLSIISMTIWDEVRSRKGGPCSTPAMEVRSRCGTAAGLSTANLRQLLLPDFDTLCPSDFRCLECEVSDGEPPSAVVLRAKSRREGECEEPIRRLTLAHFGTMSHDHNARFHAVILLSWPQSASSLN